MFCKYRNNKSNNADYNNNSLLNSLLFNNDILLDKNLYKYIDEDSYTLLGDINKEELY